MPCFSPTANVISCKIVLVLPDNAKRNKSSHIVNVALFDALDGSLKLLMVAFERVKLYSIYQQLSADFHSGWRGYNPKEDCSCISIISFDFGIAIAKISYYSRLRASS